MSININSDHDKVPSHLRRSVEEYFPDVAEVRVAGTTSKRVVMGLGTAELRKSGYDDPRIEYQWLYFHPEGALRFAQLLNEVVSSMRHSADEETTEPTEPLVVRRFRVGAGSAENEDGSETALVFLDLEALPMAMAHLPEAPGLPNHFAIPREQALQLAGLLLEAADA